MLGPPGRDGKAYAEIAHTSRTVAAFGGMDKLLADAGGTVPEVVTADLDAGFLLIGHLGHEGFLVDGKPVEPEKAEHLGSQVKDETVESRWRLSAGAVSTEVAFTYRLWGKSLVIDTISRGGNVAEVRFGKATALQDPRLVAHPFSVYNPGRPMIAVSGDEGKAFVEMKEGSPAAQAFRDIVAAIITQ